MRQYLLSVDGHSDLVWTSFLFSWASAAIKRSRCLSLKETIAVSTGACPGKSVHIFPAQPSGWNCHLDRLSLLIKYMPFVLKKQFLILLGSCFYADCQYAIDTMCDIYESRSSSGLGCSQKRFPTSYLAPNLEGASIPPDQTFCFLSFLPSTEALFPCLLYQCYTINFIQFLEQL